MPASRRTSLLLSAGIAAAAIVSVQKLVGFVPSGRGRPAAAKTALQGLSDTVEESGAGTQGRRQILAAAAPVILAAPGAAEAEGAAGAEINWSGQYKDPNHPGCDRQIEQRNDKALVAGRDGKPGCKDTGEGRPWQLQASIKGDQMFIDFSPKGGPKDMVAKWEKDGIRFPDGNKWTKVTPEMERADAPAPYDVKFDVDLGGEAREKASFTVRVHPEWAPKGAKQFRTLIERGWYNNCAVFRVVPGFIAQFGLPAEVQDRLANIQDDPVVKSNKRGYMVFATAGKNTRTSQLFFNYKDNDFLDRQGFAPFAEVLGDGMKVVEAFYSGYGERPNQGKLTQNGNRYLDSEFPQLTKFSKVTIL